VSKKKERATPSMFRVSARIKKKLYFPNSERRKKGDGPEISGAGRKGVHRRCPIPMISREEIRARYYSFFDKGKGKKERRPSVT